jgi:MFS family permease
MLPRSLTVPPPARNLAVLQLSSRRAFAAVAYAFFAVTAFSTAPSSLYGLYARTEGFSTLDLTLAYAVYAAGTIASLVLVGHVSDWYGRRAVLIPAIAIAILADAVFLGSRSLTGLFAARILTGLAVGAAVATATAYLTDFIGRADGVSARRAGIVATVANIGGLASGPLIAGVLARYEPHALTLSYQVFLGALLLALVLVAFSPEINPPVGRAPRYHPQRLAIPADGRGRFTAAITGVFLAFGIFGLFAGLAGTLLAGPLHQHSPALIGLTIFLAFGTGVLVQTTTTAWPAHRLTVAGLFPMLGGLALLVISAWTSPPSLGLFLAAAIGVGAGGGAIFRASLTLVIQSSGAHQRAGALATFFTAGYAGLSIPVVAIGFVLQHVSPRVTLLYFGVAVAVGILAAAPVLVRPPRG